PLADHALLGDRLSKCSPRLCAFAHQFERALCRSDEPHCVVYAAGSKPSLCYCKSSALAEQQILLANAKVIERYLCMTIRSIVVSKDIQHSLDPYSGRIQRHKHHRLLHVFSGGRICLAHNDRKLTATIAAAGRPPLPPVDNVIIAGSND